MTSPRTCILGHTTNLTHHVWNTLDLLECTTCGLVWRRTFDLAEGHYTDIEVAVTPEKLRDRRKNSGLRVELMKGILSSANAVGDIGSGEGTFLSVLKERYPNVQVLGIEPGDDGVTYANASGIPTIQRTLESLSQDDVQQLEVATMFHVIEHLENPLEALRSLYRILPTNAWLVIETPNVRSYTYQKSNYTHPLIYPEHLYYFSPETLAETLKQAGFTVRSMRKRDFLDGHLSIGECLVRLGLKASAYKQRNADQQPESVNSTSPAARSGFLRDLIRKKLNILVSLLGRKEYIFAIAQKV